MDSEAKGKVVEVSSARRIISPWDAHEYRNQLALNLERFALFIKQDSSGQYQAERPSPRASSFFASIVRRVPIVLWRDDLRRPAAEGAELFVGREFNLDAVRFEQLWVYEVDVAVKFEDGTSDSAKAALPPWFSTAAVAIVKSDRTFIAYQIFQPWMEDVPQSVLKAARGGDLRGIAPRVLGVPLTRETVTNTYGISTVAALLEFMNLEIAALSDNQVTRQVRRALQRKNQPSPEIRTVILRRKRSERAGSPHSEIDWSCRWLVGGHWRNQWFPKTSEHRPVYVAPHVKGPEGKPFRENHSEKIFVVAR